MEKDDEEISIDFGKIKNWFKSKKKEEKEGDNNSQTANQKTAEQLDKKEDEVEIDFSKLKNLFKSKKSDLKEQEHVHKTENKKDDEEISFDFGKIKKFFKSEKDIKEASDEEIAINWNSIASFFKKYGMIFIILIPVILSIYVRMQPAFLPVTDQWAENSVINSIKAQITESINQQYPNLPDANKNALVDTELQKVMSSNKAQLDQQIKATSAYFKSFFQDENGKMYMPDIDPYYWFRYAKNIVEHGHPGDILKDGKPFDNHQLAPLGRFVVPDVFHSYFLAYFYKFLHFFAPNLTLMRSMFYYPVFVSALSVLIVFLIGKKIAGNLGGFFAGLIMAINSAFLGRTLFGHADSDAWVVFFPLFVTWLFVTIIDTKSTIRIAVVSIIAGLFSGLFSSAWSGWWFIFDFLLATIGVTFLYLVLTNFDEIKRNAKLVFFNHKIRNIIVMGFVYFISTAIFVTLFSDWSAFRNSFFGPLSFPSIKAPAYHDLWPNVLTTVAELNEGSVNGIINSVGGQFLFFISLIGLVLAISRKEGMKKFDFVYIACTVLFYGAYFMFIKLGINISVFGLVAWIMLPIALGIVISIYKKDHSYDFRLSLLLSLWVVATIFASIKGIRFTLLLAPAFSVAFGVALGKLYEYLSKSLTKELKIHKAIGSSMLIVLLLLIYVNPIRGAISAAGSDIPLVNDAWYDTLVAIKQNSSQDAIITSWWDFGHHFKALADRGVTFDGTTQTYPPAHWVGKLLMTDNEIEAIGILRMLDCGQNSAFDRLFKINNNTHKSLKILNEIIVLDKEKARKKLLDYKLTQQQTDEILSYTHCNPPEAYFIASEDMIGKSGVWSHFGNWNFERADIWYNTRRLSQEDAVDYMAKKFNYTRERAENIYYELQSVTSDSEANTWIAPWPGYGGTMSCSKNTDDVYACTNGLQVNLTNYDIFGIGQQGIVRPKIAAFPNKNGIMKKEYNDTTIDFGLTIVPQNENELEVVISSKELTGGMFTRMFYMQGHGLRYFKLFDHQRGLTGTDIYTYKIDWEGKDTAIVDEYLNYLKPKEEKIGVTNKNNS